MTERYEVYAHVSPSGKRYVGVTSRGMDKRWVEHVRRANQGKKSKLYSAIRKHGADRFKHELLDVLTTESGAYAAERAWIKELNPEYNQMEGGSGINHHSDEARAKIGAAGTGRVVSEETKAKLAKAHKGKKFTPERIAQMSESRKGLKLSAETVAKISASNKGKKRSAEYCARRSAEMKGKVPVAAIAARTGKPSPLKGVPRSEETKAAISAANTGKHSPFKGVKRKPSPFKGVKRKPETVAKISAAHKGKKPSPQCVAASIAYNTSNPSPLKGRKFPGRSAPSLQCLKASKEARAKLPPPMKGKAHSAETKAKMSAARLAVLARKDAKKEGVV